MSFYQLLDKKTLAEKTDTQEFVPNIWSSILLRKMLRNVLYQRPCVRHSEEWTLCQWFIAILVLNKSPDIWSKMKMGCLGVLVVIKFLETHCGSLLMPRGKHLEPQVKEYANWRKYMWGGYWEKEARCHTHPRLLVCARSTYFPHLQLNTEI